jgi:hypothetical protein
MKSVQGLYYYLEGSALFLQNKIWGKYYNEFMGFKFINLSTTMLVVILSYISLNHYNFHLSVVIFIAIVPLVAWGTYSFSNLSNRTSEHKIKDFSLLNTSIKWIYLIYTFTIMITLPVLIITLLILQSLDVI